MSAMPAVVAFRWYSLRSVCCAMMDATVVFAHAGRPVKYQVLDAAAFNDAAQKAVFAQ